jgi:GTPase-associated protein 1, N-terminal domain type 2/GTPase-associated protein 1, C-terminal domain/GTPase-associated protein 1, middle domain
MTLYQLHYTSCKNGMSGYSGFQYCAVSPGIPRAVMSEVERYTIYEPPLTLQATGTRSPDEFPINLLYAFIGSYDITIIARVQFTGLDFSNRSGNYFAHSLITGNPDDDLREVLPIELWNAPFWQSRQGDDAELSSLPPPQPSGIITRQRIAGFLATEGGTCEQIAVLLTAVEAAMDGGRQVLLIGPDAENVCKWIAAASYLLGPGIARRLSFSTYSYDPRRCSTHIVGTISAAGPLRADIVRGFQVFDLAKEAVPDVPPSPAALLLARLGVVAAADLWELTQSLHPSSLVSPSEVLLPVLASAALMLGHRLTTPELAAALGWLVADGSTVTAPQSAAAVRGALTLRLAVLSASEKHQLVAVAARSQEPGETSPEALIELVEQALVESAFTELDNGNPIGPGIELRTPAVRELAADQCSKRLQTSNPQVVVELLNWATAAGVRPAERLVWLAGRNTILPGLLAWREPPDLAEIAGEWPVLRAGTVAGLATLPGSRQQELLSSRAATFFRVHDFAADQVLGTDWLVAQVLNGSTTRPAALADFVGMQSSWRYPPADCERLIARLWDGCGWTSQEGIELVGLLDGGALTSDPVRSRLAELLSTLPTPDDTPAWMKFVLFIADLPAGKMPREQAELADELSRLIRLITLGERDTPPDEALAELLKDYEAGSEQARGLLTRLLPPLLVRHSNLSSILGLCPQGLFGSLCKFSAESLARDKLDIRSIANLVVCMQLMKNRNSTYGIDLERVLQPALREWRVSQISALAIEVDLIAENSGRSSHALKLWHQRIRRRKIPAPRLWWSTV